MKEVVFVERDYPEILTLKQCQEILQIGKNLMRYLVHNEEIPAFRVGTQWRIRKADLDRYIEFLCND